MRAAVLDALGARLRVAGCPPGAGAGQLLLRVHACAVCRTDLHVRGRRGARPRLPARARASDRRRRARRARRAGRRPVARWTCGTCRYCRCGRENLCERARFTGCDARRRLRRATRWPTSASASRCRRLRRPQAAPLLCAGLIGHRALRLAGDPRAARALRLRRRGAPRLPGGRPRGPPRLRFARAGDVAAAEFARSLGAAWAGGSDEPRRRSSTRRIIFAPVGALVPPALRASPGRRRWSAAAST